MSEEALLRELVCDLARSMFDRGLTHGSTGNISLRTPDGGYVINYRDVTAERRASAALAVAKAQAERLEVLFRDGIEVEALAGEMRRRDERDAANTHRAGDAIEVDTTNLTLEQVVDRIEALVQERVA